MQGHEDIPLNPDGERQAFECAKALREAGLHFDYILTSPLCRAVRTAEFISQQCGGTVRTEQRLIERDMKSVSGMRVDIFNPEKYANDMEPLDDVSRRMLSALTEFAETSVRDFAAVSHGASINSVLRFLSNGEIGSGKTRLKNACINILRYDDGGTISVVRYNLSAREL